MNAHYDRMLLVYGTQAASPGRAGRRQPEGKKLKNQRFTRDCHVTNSQGAGNRASIEASLQTCWQSNCPMREFPVLLGGS